MALLVVEGREWEVECVVGVGTPRNGAQAIVEVEDGLEVDRTRVGATREEWRAEAIVHACAWVEVRPSAISAAHVFAGPRYVCRGVEVVCERVLAAEQGYDARALIIKVCGRIVVQGGGIEASLVQTRAGIFHSDRAISFSEGISAADVYKGTATIIVGRLRVERIRKAVGTAANYA